jgi:hypothetical protein
MATTALLDPPALPEAEPIGHLIVLDESGDSRLQWDRTNPEQIAAARARFDDLKAKRYLAYKVDAAGKRGEVIDKFDPAAERIILHSQMVGG